ncbi:hypothetical protein [Allopusillimonas ginsengisoli]|uniref:hypothetical protein n=1 Tax=Allopusillimonas ginsengisoli TaxID=453575 RepID=UPI001020AC44|nr:hypothetical protein [Allopusillimonas ginsengisoli]TEA79489.1 hypothetical protein ERE07_00565 [Allopusillimonas ginsengisoli]
MNKLNDFIKFCIGAASIASPYFYKPIYFEHLYQTLITQIGTNVDDITLTIFIFFCMYLPWHFSNTSKRAPAESEPEATLENKKVGEQYAGKEW